MIEAINEAARNHARARPRCDIMGNTSAISAACFAPPRFVRKNSEDPRFFDTPISENGIIAAAVGMGAYGLRPVPEIQFADYIYPGLDQLISEAARLRYRSAGEFIAPMTVRSPFGGGIFGGQTHSQSPEAIFTHVAGLKTVIPATPYDARACSSPQSRTTTRSSSSSRSASTTGRSRATTTSRLSRGRSIPTASCPKAITRSR